MPICKGQLEQTISESFTRATNLRAFIFKTNQCPPAILNCQSIFSRLVDPRAHNTLVSDVMSFAAQEPLEAFKVGTWNPKATTRIIPKLQALIHAYDKNANVDRGQFFNDTTIHGLRYTTSAKHFGNSCALVVLSPSDIQTPAIIDTILKIRSSADTVETLLAIRCYKALENAGAERPSFNAIGLSVWSSKLGELEVVKAGAVHSHYASLPFESAELGAVVAVVSLARVSPPLQQDGDSDILDLTAALSHLSF